MATVDNNQQSFLPYDAAIGKDCSQGFCSIYCPQWCYTLFPPPPSRSLSAANDLTTTAFSPLVIAIIAILASALLLVSYYTFVSKMCSSLFFCRRPVTVTHEERHVTPPNGLEEDLIDKIAVLRYKREDGVVEGTDCSVCLGEFKEEESLRVLPKCSHAFHLQCIDTWLKSHANCPLCRTNIVVEQDVHDEEIVVIVEGGGDGEVEIGEEEEEENVGGSLEACQDRVSIADVLRMSMEEEYMVAKNCGLVEGEEESGNGRNRRLNCVMRTVSMKRSVPSGRFFSGRQARGRNFLLPV